MTTSVQKRDESGLKAVKRVLCRRQAVTYRHTCEPARKEFSREIRRKRSPMRKMPEESLHICALSLRCLLFSPLLGRTLTSLYSYLAFTARLSRVRSSVDGFTTVQKMRA